MSGPGANVILSWVGDLADLEEQIEALQASKKDFYAAIRDEHGKPVANGLKAAMRIHRMDSEKRTEADRVDAEAARILSIIESAGDRAPRATRVASPVPLPPHDAETGELKSPDPHPLEVDGGQPQPSPDAAPAQKAAAHVSAAAGQDVVIADGQSEHQSEAEPWTGNEPGVEDASSADHFEPPAFLVKKQTMADYRPLCKHPGNCSSYGLKHCRACLKTEPDVEESEAAA